MPEPDTRVSTLELFFDLVFVFTITQVALIVERHPSWSATAQASVELLVIYWMYGGYAWLTNALVGSLQRVRAALLLGMAAFLVVSLAVPRAFAADGPTFGIAYLALTVVHLVAFVVLGERATVAALVRIGAANVVAALLLVVAGSTHGGVHWPFWIAAVLVQWMQPIIARSPGNFTIGVAHFAERHGLMIIIVLGESLVSVALAAQQEPVDAALVTGTLCGLVAAAAMWWCYFSTDDEDAARALERRPFTTRGWYALIGYDLTHVLMMAGVVSMAAGARLSLPRLTEPTSATAAWYIGGGVGLYLLALAAFRAVLGFASPWLRAACGLLVLASVPVGTTLGAGQQLALIAATIVGMLLVEFQGSGRAVLRDRAG